MREVDEYLVRIAPDSPVTLTFEDKDLRLTVYVDDFGQVHISGNKSIAILPVASNHIEVMSAVDFDRDYNLSEPLRAPTPTETKPRKRKKFAVKRGSLPEENAPRKIDPVFAKARQALVGENDGSDPFEDQ